MNNEVNNVNQNNLNSENNLSNENKKGYSKIIIIVLVVLLVGALGFICYDKFINKEKPPVPTPTPTPTPSATPSPVPTNSTKKDYAEWMEYILKQNITKIEVSRVPCDEDTFESKTVVLNTNQLKEIFKKFMNYKLMETHGGGGWTCGESLNIKYLKNGKEYELEYLGNEGWFRQGYDLTIENDKDLKNAFQKSADIKDTDENEGAENYTAYTLSGADLLFDEYFK